MMMTIILDVVLMVLTAGLVVATVKDETVKGRKQWRPSPDDLRFNTIIRETRDI